MELWLHDAMQIDPRNISLFGTLGGLLTEQRRIDEAKPLLTRCLLSKAPHDRASSTFYFGLIHRREGNLTEAKRSFETALSIWTAHWFTARVQRELAELSSLAQQEPTIN